MAGPTKPSEGETRMARANVLTQTTNQILNEGFKGLVLLNGGGAAAMAAFLQAIWDKPSAAPMRIYLLCQYLRQLRKTAGVLRGMNTA
jgi:hypothetical protein